MLFNISLQGQQQEHKQINWLGFEEAIRLNKTENRKIMVYVFSDNCGWCRKMEAETFASPAIIQVINSHFYPVKINARITDTIRYDGRSFGYIPADPGLGRPAYHELILLLLQGRLAYPSTAFLDENLVYLGLERGYKSADPFGKYLKYISEEVYKSGKSFDDYLEELF